jgi:hypothetical protein
MLGIVCFVAWMTLPLPPRDIDPMRQVADPKVLI